MTYSHANRRPWQYRRYHLRRLRVLLRPICWFKGHATKLILTAVYVAEDAPKPPATRCERCGKAPA